MESLRYAILAAAELPDPSIANRHRGPDMGWVEQQI